MVAAVCRVKKPMPKIDQSVKYGQNSANATNIGRLIVSRGRDDASSMTEVLFSFIGWAISGHPAANIFDLGFGQQRRCSDLKAAVILPRQGFDLDRKPHRLCKRWSDHNHAVMGQQTGRPAFQRGNGMLREHLSSERRVWRAADRVAAGRAHHIVDGWNAPLHDRKRRAVDGVRMDDGAHVRPRAGCRDETAIRSTAARSRRRCGRSASR